MEFPPCRALVQIQGHEPKCHNRDAAFYRQPVTPAVCQACPSKVTGGVVRGPNLIELAAEAAKSVKAVAVQGVTQVPFSELLRRLNICNDCPLRNGMTCAQCGCNLPGKASLTAWTCGVGKWDPPTYHSIQEDPPTDHSSQEEPQDPRSPVD